MRERGTGWDILNLLVCITWKLKMGVLVFFTVKVLHKAPPDNTESPWSDQVELTWICIETWRRRIKDPTFPAAELKGKSQFYFLSFGSIIILEILSRQAADRPQDSVLVASILNPFSFFFFSLLNYEKELQNLHFELRHFVPKAWQFPYIITFAFKLPPLRITTEL